MGRFQRSLLALILCLMVLVPSSFAWYLLGQYFESELEFRRSGTFLNFEQAGYRLSEGLQQHARWQKRAVDGTWIVQSDHDVVALIQQQGEELSLASGSLPKGWETSLRQHLNSMSPNETSVWFSAGQNLLLQRAEMPASFRWNQLSLNPGSYLMVWTLPSHIAKELTDPRDGTLWLMNTQGDLIFHPEGSLPKSAILKDPLVQKYIQNPLTRFQSWMSEGDDEFYGFAMHVPQSNLLLFARMPLGIWTSPIFDTIIKAAIGLALGLVLIAILVRSFVANLRVQATALAQRLEDFAQGYFIPPEVGDIPVYQELEPLRDAIVVSTHRVRDRMTQLEHGGNTP